MESLDRLMAEVRKTSTGKPETVLDTIVMGQFRKWHDNVLLGQPYIRDQDKSVGQLITDLILQVKENIVVKRWCRFQIGV